MQTDPTFTPPSEAEIAQALAEIPSTGWPEDDDELVALFDRMLGALIGRRERWNLTSDHGQTSATMGRRAPWWGPGKRR